MTGRLFAYLQYLLPRYWMTALIYRVARVRTNGFKNFLITRFVRQTSLTLETNEDEADAVLTARIERYANAPTSVSGEERAELNRISLSVSVRYMDRVEDKELLQRSFQSFEDYNPLDGGLEKEEEAALSALDNIADDIFTAATSNW